MSFGQAVPGVSVRRSRVTVYSYYKHLWDPVLSYGPLTAVSVMNEFFGWTQYVSKLAWPVYFFVSRVLSPMPHLHPGGLVSRTCSYKLSTRAELDGMSFPTPFSPLDTRFSPQHAARSDSLEVVQSPWQVLALFGLAASSRSWFMLSWNGSVVHYYDSIGSSSVAYSQCLSG